MINLYAEHIFPRLLDWAMRSPPIRRQREKVIPLAQGQVLEIGAGSGLNFRYYDPEKVRQLWALEPSEALRRKASERARAVRFPVTFLGCGAEKIPLDDEVADAVVVTYALCTIPDVTTALSEMYRVLKPAGALLFSEHGKAPTWGVAGVQRLLDPAWTRMAGGCHLNRDVSALLREAGFRTDAIQSRYLPGPKWVQYHSWGSARRG